MSDDYQAEIAFLAWRLRRRSCASRMQRLRRTVHSHAERAVAVVRCSGTSRSCAARWRNFASATTNAGSSSLDYLTPAKLASNSLHSEPPHEYTHSLSNKSGAKHPTAVNFSHLGSVILLHPTCVEVNETVSRVSAQSRMT